MTYRHGLGDYARSEKVKLATTAATAIYTVPSQAGSLAKLDTLRLVNTTANAVDLTIELHDASASVTYTLVNRTAALGNAIAAGESRRYELDGIVLDASDELRLTAGTGNAIEAVLTLNEPSRQMA